MPKNIAELPRFRAEAGKGKALKKERELKDEPSVVIEDDDGMADLQKMSESQPESKKKSAKEEAFEFTEELKEMFKKPVEKPSGMARLFGSAQGVARKIGDYFEQAKKWTEQQFAKKELKKGETKENITESIKENEGPIDLAAFKEVLEGTSEAVDLDVSEFAERNENGLANLEAKAEEAGASDEIPEETRKHMESLEREAEKAKAEFKEEMSDEEYEARAKEAEEILGKSQYKVPSPKELKERTGKKAGGYRVSTPEELEERAAKVKKEKFKASGYKIPSPEEMELETKEKMKEKRKYVPPSPKQFEEKIKAEAEKMEELPAEEQLEIIKKQLKNLRSEQEEFKRRAGETRKKGEAYEPKIYKRHEELLKEIIKLEKAEKKLEAELKEFSKEEREWFKKGEKMGKEEKADEEDLEIEEEKEEPGEEAKESLEKGEEQESTPFSKKVIDESHDKYLELKDYEDEHGEAPKGESAGLYLSFSFDDYKKALDKDPKKASRMEEEMYEKLTAYDKKKKRAGIITRTGKIIE